MNDTLLKILVGIGAAQQQLERYALHHPTALRLSPAPKPVTQINRLTPACSMAGTTVRVAAENSRTGPSSVSGPNRTPNVMTTTSTPGNAAAIPSASMALPTRFSRFGPEPGMRSADRARARTE